MPPDKCLAAVFEEAGGPLRLREFPLVDPPPGHVLARVRMATICGSDLHTVEGRRAEPAPLILGHEILAEVAAPGQEPVRAANGEPLSAGDRITFTIMASCGACENCRRGLPQKCRSLFKYGHASCTDALPLSGGFAQYVYLRPGTAIYRLPDSLSDAEVCPANCALATVVNGIEAVSVKAGERVLVQGAGLLGIYATALLKDLGAVEIAVTDVNDSRLEVARRFGADATLNVDGLDDDDVVDGLGEGRFDCVIEVSGAPSAVRPGLGALALGGRYVIIGLVCPGSEFTVDGNLIARNYLEIRGIHNYAPEHLARGLSFLERTRTDFPYSELVGCTYPLSEINAAFSAASQRKAIRVGVVPD